MTLAVAGFGQNEIEITLANNVLVVRGEKQKSDKKNYVHHGISFRDFTRQFTLGEHLVVESVSLDHGLLNIDLQRHVPESAKIKRISITTK